MSKRMVATKPDPVKRRPKAVQPAQKAKTTRKSKPAPAAASEPPTPEPVGDWWAASHLTLKMLAVTLARYGENEGQWQRADVREDLAKAQILIRACLDQVGPVVH